MTLSLPLQLPLWFFNSLLRNLLRRKSEKMCESYKNQELTRKLVLAPLLRSADVRFYFGVKGRKTIFPAFLTNVLLRNFVPKSLKDHMLGRNKIFPVSSSF